MKKVVIGVLGPKLDRGLSFSKRWEKWRPTVSLFQHEDLLFDRFEFLYQPNFNKIKDILMSDIESVSPETEISPRPLSFKNPWDFGEVYSTLLDFAKSYPFNTEKEEY